MDEILVSVIVPVYNLEKYIVRCMDSIAAQTYRNLEVLLIDDGSTDNSRTICEEYCEKDSRFRVIHQENKGLSGARNTGLDHFGGDYVALIDGDDFWDPSMIARMMKEVRAHQADMVSCELDMYYGGTIVPSAGEVEGKLLTKEAAYYMLFGETSYCSACAKLYHRRLWEGLRYPENIRYSEDMYVAHLLIDRCNTIVHIAEGLYKYSQETVSLTRSAFKPEKLNMFYATELWIDFCKEKYPACLERAYQYYYMVFLNFFMFFAEDDHALYRTYQKRLRKELQACLHNQLLSKKDKLKAILLCVSTPGMYRVERKLMGK